MHMIGKDSGFRPERPATRKVDMQIGVILGDVHSSVSPREHLDGLLRQVEAVQRNGLTYVTIGHHYLYGDYRWLQPIPTLARIAAELDDSVTLGTAGIPGPPVPPIAPAGGVAAPRIP